MTGKHKGQRLTRRERRDLEHRQRLAEILRSHHAALQALGDLSRHYAAKAAEQAEAEDFAHRFFANACGGGR